MAAVGPLEGCFQTTSLEFCTNCDFDYIQVDQRCVLDRRLSSVYENINSFDVGFFVLLSLVSVI